METKRIMQSVAAASEVQHDARPPPEQYRLASLKRATDNDIKRAFWMRMKWYEIGGEGIRLRSGHWKDPEVCKEGVRYLGGALDKELAELEKKDFRANGFSGLLRHYNNSPKDAVLDAVGNTPYVQRPKPPDYASFGHKEAIAEAEDLYKKKDAKGLFRLVRKNEYAAVYVASDSALSGVTYKSRHITAAYVAATFWKSAAAAVLKRAKNSGISQDKGLSVAELSEHLYGGIGFTVKQNAEKRTEEE